MIRLLIAVSAAGSGVGLALVATAVVRLTGAMDSGVLLVPIVLVLLVTYAATSRALSP